ncbi:MAG: hypothetical protein EOO38_17085, partial [Cytophagaceae bacterium]
MPLPHLKPSNEEAFRSSPSPLDQLARPPWLRNSSLADDKWIVETDDPRGRRDTRQTINFHVPIEVLRVDGPGGLTDAKKRIEIYVAELQSGTRSIPIVFHGNKSWLSLDGVAQQLGYAQATSLAFGYLDPVVNFVSDKHPSLLKYLARARRKSEDSGARSKNQLGALLRPWDQLWDLRHKLKHDAIGYRAHDGIFTSNSQALSLQRTPHRPVPLAPEYQACYLINASLSYLSIADTLLFIHASLQRIYNQFQGVERRRKIKELVYKVNLKIVIRDCGVGNPDRVGETYIKPNRGKDSCDTIALYNLLYDYLPAACLIIIAAFTARRTGELESLQS